MYLTAHSEVRTAISFPFSDNLANVSMCAASPDCDRLQNTMENSATAATGKKECKSSGLDGSATETPKKPSPTTLSRGTALHAVKRSCRSTVAPVIFQLGQKQAAHRPGYFCMLACPPVALQQCLGLNSASRRVAHEKGWSGRRRPRVSEMSGNG